jgi:hypothetical protein
MSKLAPFVLPLRHFPHLVASSGTELLFSMNRVGDRPACTAVVRLDRWPPRVFEHVPSESTLHAARSPSGRWLLHFSPGGAHAKQWRLRTYARGNDKHPFSDIPVPLPPPDLTEMLPHLDEARRHIESAHTQAIESLAFLGERAVLVPRHVGVGARQWPLLRYDGGWVEARDLPPFTKAPSAASERCPMHTVRLADGGDLLIWDGHCFEWEKKGFVRTIEHRIEAPWWLPWAPVPSGRDGFFYMGNHQLFEVHRGAKPPREHLEGISIYAMSAGPSGTLLLKLSAGGVMLYDPADDALIEIPPELLPPDKEIRFVWWSDAGYLVACEGIQQYALHAVPKAELDRLPRKRASAEAKHRQTPRVRAPAAALSGAWSASRSLVAVEAASGMIASVMGDQLLAHSADDPRWRWKAEDDIVAVAAAGGHFLALDAAGLVHTLDPATGERLAAEEVAPRPRSLCASPAGAYAVLSAGGLHLVHGDSLRLLSVTAPLAASFDGAGARLFVVGEGRRAAMVEVEDGTIEAYPPPPEEVHALAWTGGSTWFGLGERSLLRFDAGERKWSVALEGAPGDHLVSAPGGARIALSKGPSSADVLDVDTLKVLANVTYPDTYQNAKEPLQIKGLAFLDDERLCVGLTRGNANLLSIGKKQALRLDPLPGQPKDRWVFIYDGAILIAG